MMKRNTVFLLILILINLGCYDDCPDQKWPDFVETDLEWFDYIPGDTIYFNDNLGNDSLFLTCVSRVQYADTFFHPVVQCPEEGYLEIDQFINYGFTSTIPHSNNRYLTLDMELNSKYGGFNIQMAFNDEVNNFYFFYFRYNTDEQKLYNWLSRDVNDVGSITINGKDYSDVFTINHSDYEGPYPNAYYDTIYYNSEGFLKFNSSKHGYVLERLP